MATELAKAYVQIIPSAQGISGKIQQAIDPEAEPAGASFGSKLVGKLKGIIATAAIGKALGSAISEGANLEQSLGGIETLFKDSADKVKANAAEAYRTAGMSANDYMELTTSFSASLLSSLSNDTSKAADVADMAMTDMSDNANKMGTNMEDIKNAYQGFAKQNYTMLDNLKLGYGGTKTEMERLLADAQKITGVKYDINNLSDVYSAIHVIQGQLDITGTTAKEAATTIFRLHEGRSAKCYGSNCSWNGHKTSFVSTGRDDDNFSCWKFTSCSMECNFCTSGGVSNIYTDCYTTIGNCINAICARDCNTSPNRIATAIRNGKRNAATDYNCNPNESSRVITTRR